MAYLIGFILLYFGYFSSLFSNRFKVLRLLLLLFMSILIFGNFENADYYSYSGRYEYIKEFGETIDNNQLGFYLLMKICAFFGLNYNGFLLITTLISFYFIDSTVSKYCHNRHLVYSMYMIYPFFLDAVQIKHFLASSIIIYCVRYLEENSFKNNIKYVIFVLLASTIHIASIFFLPVIFIIRKDIYTIFKYSILIVLAFIFLSNIGVIENVSKLIMGGRVDSYFDNRPRFGWILMYTNQLVNICIVFILKRKIYNLYSLDSKEARIADIVCKINTYLIILFPLYLINMVFDRILRMTMILTYILISITFFKSNINKKIIVLGLLSFYLLIMFYIYVYPFRESVFYSILNNNFIFNTNLN